MSDIMPEIKKIAAAANMQERFEEEVDRLLRSGGFNPDEDSVNVLFGVALENLSHLYCRFERNTRTYKNLIKF